MNVGVFLAILDDCCMHRHLNGIVIINGFAGRSCGCQSLRLMGAVQSNKLIVKFAPLLEKYGAGCRGDLFQNFRRDE